MALASAAAENGALSGISALTGHFLSLHTATPGTTGASEVSGGSYARVAVTWGTPSAGSMANTGALTVNLPASTTAAFFGDWSLVSVGVYYIGGALSPSVTTGASAGTVTFAIGAATISAS
jgi:hypothetical protein